MYLAIDIVMAMLDEEEWFTKEIDQSKITNKKTSVMTIFEILKINSETGVSHYDLLSLLNEKYIEVVSFTPKMIDGVQSILDKYFDLFDIGSLNSIHVAHSISLDEPIVSTNPMCDYLDEIEHFDPRKL